jgi:hypothetical protein
MKKTKRDLEVELWNLKYSVGTPVVVRMDSGEKRETKTRSRAEILSGHTAVIWLEGIAGCYCLDRVKPLVERKRERESKSRAGCEDSNK